MAVRGGVPRDSFLEGPAFDAQGRLYCVDLAYGRIFCVSQDGTFELVVRYDGVPNGLKVLPGGKLLVADHTQGLLEVDPETEQIRPLLKSAWGEPFRGLNDLCISRAGDVYFTDQGASGLENPAGSVYCLRATGKLELLVERMPSPNGIVLSPDERTLFVAVTRANAVWRVPLDLYGSEKVRRVGLFIQMSGGVGPDGIAMTQDGTLWVAHIGMGAVWAFDHRGQPILRIDSPTGLATTNMAIRGGDTLYITESASGSILKATIPERSGVVGH
jgi:gluconolactonase